MSDEGWGEIVELLGLDDKIRAAEEQLERNLAAMAAIKLDLAKVDAFIWQTRWWLFTRRMGRG